MLLTSFLFRPRLSLPVLSIASLGIVAMLLFLDLPAFAQRPLPYIDAGRDSNFAELDFADLYRDQQMWGSAAQTEASIHQQKSAEDGVVSFLDMQAPKKAIDQFKQGAYFFQRHQPKEALSYFQKAIHIYPKFVSAHIALGLAYYDQRDSRAKSEFLTASELDSTFPTPFVNLGLLAIQARDFANADSDLEKAASLRPRDLKILTALAFSENGDHKFSECLRTAQRVHAFDHKGHADIHYIAASAALSIHDLSAMKYELQTFLAEDPTNPLAPIARNRLDSLAHPGQNSGPSSASITLAPGTTATRTITFPNTPYLQGQLKDEQTFDNPDDSDNSNSHVCDTCVPAPHLAVSQLKRDPGPQVPPQSFVTWDKMFTIHQAVDETALFFAVSHLGKMIDNLSLSDIQIRDDNKAPAKILQFIPQSKLPLRLGLLIDTSGSVEQRFSFEKRAAERFMSKVLTGESDLGFVAGFSTDVKVAQDFTRDAEMLNRGVESLTDGGGTSLFDAIYYSCFKLAAYPDEGRVAKVLVVLTDGEDNSSHRSLRQALEVAEASGVTIYAISTAQNAVFDTDADQILRVIGQRSGGASVFPPDLRALDNYLGKLPDVIRSRYLIAYRPADFQPNGEYRTIHVLAQKDGKKLQVHARRGYYARESISQN